MLNVLDLFAGIGGFSLGLERTGHYRTVAFCEQDPACRRVLQKRWPCVPIFNDVRTLNKTDINERIHVITGGFPCQDISYAGRGEGLEGSRSGLWWEFHRLIEAFDPEAALIENVGAIRTRGLDQVLRSLAALGYDAEWHCIPACATGAPHERDRTWIIAHAQPLGLSRQGQLVSSVHPAPSSYREADRLVDAFRTRSLPFVCRGHDGLPPRVDQDAIKQLGNTVVPQIPELIGRALADVLQH